MIIEFRTIIAYGFSIFKEFFNTSYVSQLCDADIKKDGPGIVISSLVVREWLMVVREFDISNE